MWIWTGRAWPASRLGIRQFLDVGAGVPTAGNTHQAADELAVNMGQEPNAHVVYVDYEPIALLLIAVPHVHQPGPDGVTDIGPASVARLRELLPVGSYLAMSHITDEGVPPDVGENLVELKRMYDTSSSSNGIWRAHKDIEAMLGEFELVEPGWTWLTEWRPEETGPTVRPIAFPTPNHAVGWAGVGKKLA